MPLGTSAFHISENRLKAPLAKIPRLLVQKLVLGCGEDRKRGPGQAPDFSRKSTAQFTWGRGKKAGLRQGTQERREFLAGQP